MAVENFISWVEWEKISQNILALKELIHDNQILPSW
jgi:hypothetical protein